MLFLFLNDNKIEIEAYTLDVLFRREKKNISNMNMLILFCQFCLVSEKSHTHSHTNKQNRVRPEKVRIDRLAFFIVWLFFPFRFFLFFHCVVNFGDKYMTSIYSTNHTQPFAYIHTHDFNSNWNEWTNLHIWHFSSICTVFV